MRPGAPGPHTPATTIQIATRLTLDLRAGETVAVHVLKVLADGKWAVGLKGRVFPATSTLPLNTGDTLLAVVERAGRQIRLRLGESALPPQPGSRPAAEALSQAVAQAFLREGALPAEPVLARVRARVLARARSHGGSERKTARTLAVASGKGIDPDSPGLEPLLALLQFEDRPDPDDSRRRRLPERESEQRDAVKAEIARGGDDTSLGLFNALASWPGELGSWVAVPFSFRHGDKCLDGTARFLMSGGRPVRLALEVHGSASWGFEISEASGGRRLRVFCDDGRLRDSRAAAAALSLLREKLQNHGVETDDSIRDGHAFDGYSADGGAVDLLG